MCKCERANSKFEVGGGLRPTDNYSCGYNHNKVWGSSQTLFAVPERNRFV